MLIFLKISNTFWASTFEYKRNRIVADKKILMICVSIFRFGSASACLTMPNVLVIFGYKRTAPLIP